MNGRIKSIISSRSDEDLLKDWLELDKQSISKEGVPELREMYMNEFEKRFPEKFDMWLFSDDNDIKILVS